jgi:hypothetical protein
MTAWRRNRCYLWPVLLSPPQGVDKSQIMWEQPAEKGCARIGGHSVNVCERNRTEFRGKIKNRGSMSIPEPYEKRWLGTQIAKRHFSGEVSIMLKVATWGTYPWLLVDQLLENWYRLVDKYMRQPPPLGSGVRLSGQPILTVWILRKVKYIKSDSTVWLLKR